MVLTASLLGGGSLSGWLWVRIVHAGDGGPAASALVSASPALGLGALLAVFLIAAVFAALGSRLCTPRVGLACAGFSLVGAAWMSGSMMDLMRWAPAPDSLWRLAAEGAIAAILAVIVAALVNSVGGSDRRDGADPPASAQGALGLCIALAVGAAAAWVIARETTKGQTIAAGVFAGFIGATVARVTAPRSSLLAVAAGVGLLAVIGPILGGVLSGADALRAIYEGRFIPLARPMPLDWIGGMFVGLPLGLTWASSFDKRLAQPQARAEPRPAA